LKDEESTAEERLYELFAFVLLDLQTDHELTSTTALRRFSAWQSALFMGKWRASGTQLRGKCAESRHAAASLRVPGYVRVSSLRDEMCLSGCLYNRSSAVSLGVTCEAFA